MTRRLQFLGTATLTALATFVYYSAFASLAGGGTITIRDAFTRGVASIVVAAFLTVRARQHSEQAAATAAAEGFVLGIVVVVCNSLFGSDYAGHELAMRTLGILTGVPALAAMSQALTRRGSTAENDGTPIAG